MTGRILRGDWRTAAERMAVILLRLAFLSDTILPVSRKSRGPNSPI